MEKTIVREKVIIAHNDTDALWSISSLLKGMTCNFNEVSMCNVDTGKERILEAINTKTNTDIYVLDLAMENLDMNTKLVLKQNNNRIINFDHHVSNTLIACDNIIKYFDSSKAACLIVAETFGVATELNTDVIPSLETLASYWDTFQWKTKDKEIQKFTMFLNMITMDIINKIKDENGNILSTMGVMSVLTNVRMHTLSMSMFIVEGEEHYNPYMENVERIKNSIVKNNAYPNIAVLNMDNFTSDDYKYVSLASSMVFDEDIVKVEAVMIIKTDQDNGGHSISLRSKSIPVVNVVEKYKGGGHDLACGCRIPECVSITRFTSELYEALCYNPSVK